VRRQQWFTSTQLDYRLNADFSLLGRFRYSRTEDRNTQALEAQLTEGSIGIAFRPVRSDKLNGLARLTHLADRRPTGVGGAAWDENVLDVLSLEGIYEFNPKWEWFSKLAGRRQEQSFLFSDTVTTTSYLTIQRINANLYKPLDLGVEYRILTQQETDQRQQGFLTELMWKVQKNFRVGVGYNFTDFSDNEFSLNDYSVDGWFVRVQGRY
jgi:hypothetical protein